MIAIHHRINSFSERWIKYCVNHNIDYKLVNAYDDDIIKQVKDCCAFMWHHHHTDFKDILTAKRILFALEQTGMKVFPDFNTAWHFDDKVAQKYLLESINAPLVPSYVFYEKEKALKWAKATSYPKVWKLRGGAGATNVKLIRSNKEAIKFINKAFGKGFPQFDKINNLKERWGKYKEGRENFNGVLKGIGRLFLRTQFSKLSPNEKGYIYFQDFILNDGFDIRVVIIDGKAVALKRLVRKNDFRASGSGNLVFENEKIDKRYLEIGFDISKKISVQSLAIDLIHGKNDNIYIVEISYGFPMLNFLEGASGYWDTQLNWIEGVFNPQEWMIESLLK